MNTWEDEPGWNEWGTRDWAETRKNPREYARIKTQIETNGIHCKLFWQRDVQWGGQSNPFFSLGVIFPSEFEHLINPRALKAKDRTSSGFHISLGNRDKFKDHRDYLDLMLSIYKKYKVPKEVYIRHVWVGSGSSLNVGEDDPLYKELHDLVKRGTGTSHVHISAD